MENNVDLIRIQELSRKIFGNSLLLTEVSKKLSSRDLLKARLISKLWCEIASNLCNLRPDIRCLPVVYDAGDKKYRTAQRNDRGERTKDPPKYLEDLNILIDTNLGNWKFPCGVFSFTNGLLRSSDFLDFLRLHGKNVRVLHMALQLYGAQSHILEILSCFKNVLLTGAPNVKTLQLQIHGNVKEDSLADSETGEISHILLPPNSILPNVETIQLSYGRGQVVTEILKAAVNLKKFLGCPLSPVESLIEAGKVPTVRHLTLYTSTVEILKLELLSRSTGLQLKSLDVMNQLDPKETGNGNGNDHGNDEGDLTPQYMRVADSLSRILESSKKSLKKVEIRQGSHLFNRRVFWPALEKCTKLQVEGHLPSVEEASRSISCFLKASVFPNLHRITFHRLSHFPEIGLDSESNPDPNFLPLTTVRHLEIQRRLPTGNWSQKILRIFPNVEILIIEQIINFQEIAKYLWDFTKVKRLGLGLACGVSYSGNSFPCLDAAFTGLTESVVQHIRSGEITREDMTGFQLVEKSILDLKELQNFNFRFVHHTHELTESYDLLSAEVTGELVFKHMEKTKIEIGTWLINEEKNFEDWKLKMGSALEPMSPYAKWYLDNNQKHSGWFLN